jgi:hypothetical protein
LLGLGLSSPRSCYSQGCRTYNVVTTALSLEVLGLLLALSLRVIRVIRIIRAILALSLRIIVSVVTWGY